jgi:hypothetical protein
VQEPEHLRGREGRFTQRGKGVENDYEPQIEDGVVRCSSKHSDHYTYEQGDRFWNTNVYKDRNKYTEVRTRNHAGRRSRNTLTIEGIINDYSARDYARELIKFGPLQFLAIERNGKHMGMFGKGYVHYKFSKDAEDCARNFSVLSRKGKNPRLCFARWCQEEIDIDRCISHGGSAQTFNVSAAADPEVIMGREYDDWGLPNFGVPQHMH